MKPTLEERVATLERRVAEMQSHQANGKEKPWLRTMGMFAGDDVMKEVFDEALKNPRDGSGANAPPPRESNVVSESEKMILLDTDHLSVHAFPESDNYQKLAGRIHNAPDDFGTTIVCVEEQLRGWLAAIHKKPDVAAQVPLYNRLGKLWEYFHDWNLLPFDDAAAKRFKLLRKKKIRIGSQDLKIASIVLNHDALLLSANLRDFRQVPGLRVENWLEP